MTGVKEQTSATYARHLAIAGFTVLTFDATYQGGSESQPRGLENPPQRVEDIKCAVSYLTTLHTSHGLNPQKVGVLGICASGRYASFAAQSDLRIKPLATVSAACVGAMTRHGGVHETQEEDSLFVIEGALKAAGQRRTDFANGKKEETPAMFDTDPEKITTGTDSFFRDAAAYYGTSRGKHERSDQRVPAVIYDLMLGYDSFWF